MHPHLQVLSQLNFLTVKFVVVYFVRKLSSLCFESDRKNYTAKNIGEKAVQILLFQYTINYLDSFSNLSKAVLIDTNVIFSMNKNQINSYCFNCVKLCVRFDCFIKFYALKTSRKVLTIFLSTLSPNTIKLVQQYCNVMISRKTQFFKKFYLMFSLPNCDLHARTDFTINSPKISIEIALGFCTLAVV